MFHFAGKFKTLKHINHQPETRLPLSEDRPWKNGAPDNQTLGKGFLCNFSNGSTVQIP